MVRKKAVVARTYKQYNQSATMSTIPFSPPVYSTVDSGCSAHLTPNFSGLLEVRAVTGMLDTAKVDSQLEVVACGKGSLPGPVFVVPKLDGPLVSFHELERHGLEYRRHPVDPRLREWLTDGIPVPRLTYCVYPNNIGLLHPEGAAHIYPQDFPSDGQCAYSVVTVHQNDGGGQDFVRVLGQMGDNLSHISSSHPVQSTVPYGLAAVTDVVQMEPVVSVAVIGREEEGMTKVHVNLVSESPPSPPPAVILRGSQDPTWGVRFRLMPKLPVLKDVSSGQGRWVRGGLACRRLFAREKKSALISSVSSSPSVFSPNPYAALADGEEEMDHAEKDALAQETQVIVARSDSLANTYCQPCDGHPTIQAKRAAKLWTSVEAGTGSQLIHLVHSAVHLGEDRLLNIINHDLMTGLPRQFTTAAIRRHFPDCPGCVRGKSRYVRRDRQARGMALLRAPVSPLRMRRHPPGVGVIGDKVAIDLVDWAGQNPDLVDDNSRYFMSCTDYSPGGFYTAIPIGDRGEASLVAGLRKLQATYRKYGHTLKSIRADGEYFQNVVEAAVWGMGIVPEFSVPYEHQQNGLVERSNQTVGGHLRAMLWSADPACPKKWTLALEYFTHLWNATSVYSPGISAWSQFYHRKWDFGDMPLLPWGVRVESMVPPKPHKADDRTMSGFFMGVATTHLRAILLLPTHLDEAGMQVIGKRVVVRRSYWVLGNPMLRPLVGDEDVPGPTWTKDHAGLSWIPGSRQEEEGILSEAYEQRDMAVEDTREHTFSRDLLALRRSEALARVAQEQRARMETIRSEAELRAAAKQLLLVETRRRTLLRKEEQERKLVHKQWGLVGKECIRWVKLKALVKTRKCRVMVELLSIFTDLLTDSTMAVDAIPLFMSRRSTRKTAGYHSRYPGDVTIPPRATRLRAQSACLKGELAPVTFSGLGNEDYAGANGDAAGDEDIPLQFARLLDGATILGEAAVAVGVNGMEDILLDSWVYQWRACVAKGVSLDVIDFIPDPKGWKRMISHPHAAQFLQAVDVEVSKLQSLGAGSPVPGGRSGVPVGAKILRSSFVFATKRFADSGLLDKFKARLVADGSQQQGEDMDTHAPTIGGTTLRVLFAIAAMTGAHISKLDVESAFLIEKIDTPTYVELPPEYSAYKGEKRTVWRLLRSLYGLRQAGRLFWLGLRTTLLGAGFVSSDHDPCLFVRKELDGTYTYVATHVDDLAVVSSSLERNRSVRDSLLDKYRGVKWDDTANTFVGLALHRMKQGSLKVSQPAYSNQVLRALDITPDGITKSPFRNARATHGGEEVIPTLVPWLRLAVGLVQYLTFTRLDLLLPLNLVARQMHKPTQEVRKDMVQILQYLANTVDEGLYYGSGGTATLSAYVDASWQSEGTFSRTGFALVVGENTAVVQAYTKVQQYSTLSSQHSEIVALTEAVRAVYHVRMLLHDMGYSQLVATKVHEDNVGAISFTRGTCPLERTKHIANRDRYCREAYRDGVIQPVKIGTKVNPVNALTKEVGRAEQDALRRFLLQGKLFTQRCAWHISSPITCSV
jgi:hypothetical protein